VKIEFGRAEDDGKGHWVVEVFKTHEDGRREEGVHIFPYDAMEWRAAEYNIDPNDRETLLDIILTEPYLETETADPQRTLFVAETVQDARAHHLERIAAAKLKHGISTKEKNHPLAVVRDQSPIRPDVIAEKRMGVERERRKNGQVKKLEQ
jgi:hypothetical protein